MHIVFQLSEVFRRKDLAFFLKINLFISISNLLTQKIKAKLNINVRVKRSQKNKAEKKEKFKYF